MAIRTIMRDGVAWRWEVTGRERDGSQVRRRFTSRADAEVFDAKLRVRRLTEAGDVTARDLTMEDLWDAWLPSWAPTVRPATVAIRERSWSVALRPAIGDIRLDRLTGPVLERELRRIAATGNGGKGYGPATMGSHRAALALPLGWAVRRGILAVSPLATVGTIRQVQAIDERSAWSLAEARTFTAWAERALAEPDPVARGRLLGADGRADPVFVVLPMLLAMLWSGLRIGEARVLVWEDIVSRTSGDMVLVRRAVTRVGYREVLGDPKTRASRRAVAVLPTLARVLETQRARQDQRREERTEMGRGWRSGPWLTEVRLPAGVAASGWVFDSGRGLPVSYVAARQALERCAIAAGVRVITPHGLRHTFATVGLEMGIPAKVVQEMLGHASVTLTLNLYSHVTADLQHAVGGLFEAAMTGRGGADGTSA